MLQYAMNTWGYNLRKIREEYRFSQGDLAKVLGCNPSNIAHMESGRYASIKQNYIAKMANAWGISVAELTARLYGGAAPTKPTITSPNTKPFSNVSWPPITLVAIPVIGSVPAGYLDVRTEEASGFIYVPQENIKGMRREDLKALRVTGESMIGDGINDGDFIAFNISQKDVINGKVYICQTDDGVTIKHAYKEPNQLRLKASNPEYNDIILSEVEILGRVILFQPPATEI